MFGKVYIDGVEYELTGNPEFEYEGGQEVGYVTMVRADEAVCIVKYNTEDEEFIDGFSNPIRLDVVAEPWE